MSGFRAETSRRSGGEPLVAVMQAADFWESDDLARIGWMNRTRIRAVLLKRQVRSGSVIIVEVGRQDTAQMLFIHDDHVIEAFAPDRSDDAGALPRGPAPR